MSGDHPHPVRRAAASDDPPKYWRALFRRIRQPGRPPVLVMMDIIAARSASHRSAGRASSVRRSAPLATAHGESRTARARRSRPVTEAGPAAPAGSRPSGP